MEPRVSPKLAYLSAAGFSDSSGCPALPRPPLQRLQYSSQVAPRSVPSGCAGDGVPGRPSPRILRRCRLADPRVAPLPGLSVSPMIRSASYPASRIFRLRLVFGRVASNRAPYVSALQLQRPVALRLPLPAVVSGLIRGLPRFTCCRPRLRTLFQVSLKLLSFGAALGRISELPRLSSPWLRRSFAGVFLRFCADGRVDDESPAGPELCIRGLHRG